MWKFFQRNKCAKILCSEFFLGKRNSCHWQFGQEITPTQLCQINLLLKKKFLHKFYFINMFTFNKFIFYKSSINSIQIKFFNFSIIRHNSFYKQSYSCLQLLTSSYIFLQLLTFSYSLYLALRASYNCLHLLTAYSYLLQQNRTAPIAHY